MSLHVRRVTALDRIVFFYGWNINEWEEEGSFLRPLMSAHLFNHLPDVGFIGCMFENVIQGTQLFFNMPFF